MYSKHSLDISRSWSVYSNEYRSALIWTPASNLRDSMFKSYFRKAVLFMCCCTVGRGCSIHTDGSTFQKIYLFCHFTTPSQLRDYVAPDERWDTSGEVRRWMCDGGIRIFQTIQMSSLERALKMASLIKIMILKVIFLFLMKCEEMWKSRDRDNLIVTMTVMFALPGKT